MKKKLPFVVSYTQEMSDQFNKELKESGKCPMTNPEFYGKWDLVEVGTPEYYERLKVRREDVERENKKKD
jgi:hypothetical protein